MSDSNADVKTEYLLRVIWPEVISADLQRWLINEMAHEIQCQYLWGNAYKKKIHSSKYKHSQ